MVVFSALIISQPIGTSYFPFPGNLRDIPSMCNFCATAHCLTKFWPTKTYGKGALSLANSGADNHKPWQLVSILGCNKVKTFKQDLDMKCCFIMRQGTLQLCREWGDGLRKQALLLSFFPSALHLIYTVFSFDNRLFSIRYYSKSSYIERYLTGVDDRCLGLDYLSPRVFI